MRLQCVTTALAIFSGAWLSASLPKQRVAVDYTTSTGAAQTYKTPWQKIEEQAALENPADANSVHGLIDAILECPHSFGPIPPIMREIVEERLVQSEMNYKFGRSAGIPEENIVKIANQFVDKLRLPDYARTTSHQLEVLRFGMEMGIPSFMAPSSVRGGQPGKSPNTGEFSPAQAVHILFVLADQKMINPEYQLSPEEWENTKYQPEMERLTKYKELRDSGQLATAKKGVLVTGNSIKDLGSIISRQVSQMSLTDGMDLVNEAFEIVGTKK
jgi:hypothetical protein